MTGLATIWTALGTPVDYSLVRMVKFLEGFPPANLVGALGIAIIAVTLIIRTALYPVFSWQLRTNRRTQAEQRIIAPRLSELRKKHKGDPQKLTEEMNKLYKEHGINPLSGLSGCLPALVQMPVVIALYNGILAATRQKDTIGDKHFLWVPDVSGPALRGGFSVMLTHWPLLILPALAAMATFVQSKMMLPPPRPDMSDQEKSMQSVSRAMTTFVPFSVFLFGINFAQGVALYWVTQSMYMILQQYYAVGWGGVRVPEWLPGAHRTTPLSLAGHRRAPKPRVSGERDPANGRPTGGGAPSRLASRDKSMPGRPAARSAKGGGRKRRR